MKISRTKYVIVTKNRPTLFLTGTGELSEHFDDALILDDGEALVAERGKLDEPEKFEDLKVRISVEV